MDIDRVMDVSVKVVFCCGELPLFTFYSIDGTVNSYIYNYIFICKIFSIDNNLILCVFKNNYMTYRVYTLMVNWCGPMKVGPLYTWGLIRLAFGTYTTLLIRSRILSGGIENINTENWLKIALDNTYIYVARRICIICLCFSSYYFL